VSHSFGVHHRSSGSHQSQCLASGRSSLPSRLWPHGMTDQISICPVNELHMWMNIIDE
jgi:hypothetical protein